MHKVKNLISDKLVIDGNDLEELLHIIHRDLLIMLPIELVLVLDGRL